MIFLSHRKTLSVNALRHCQLPQRGRELGFRQAVFEVGLSPLQEPGSQGMETVEFLFGPNPGEPSKPCLLYTSRCV